MDQIIIKGRAYRLESGFRDDSFLRGRFNQLSQKVYGLDFEDLYQNGYWGDHYIPYSLLDGDKVVSNVSINLIDFSIYGEHKLYLQIGTVMTDIDYRNRGLNKAILDRVFEDWRGRCDLIYLFANDSVLDFYPKFGFSRVDQYQHSKNINSNSKKNHPKKLDMKIEGNRAFVIDRINSKQHISPISVKSNSHLVMFYLSSFMSECVYYLDELDAIAVAEFKNRVLHLHDVFCNKSTELDEVISIMANGVVNKVILGFTPENSSSFDEKLHTPDDVLFILDDKCNTFKDAKLLFPVLSHA